MNFDQYQTEVKRTSKPDREQRERLLNDALGLAGEAGEVADYLKKVLFHGHEMNPEEVIKECGDVLWYVTDMLDSLGYTLLYAAEKNKEKLRKRYPDGFSEERSRNRGDDDQVTRT